MIFRRKDKKGAVDDAPEVSGPMIVVWHDDPDSRFCFQQHLVADYPGGEDEPTIIRNLRERIGSIQGIYDVRPYQYYIAVTSVGITIADFEETIVRAVCEHFGWTEAPHIKRVHDIEELRDLDPQRKWALGQAPYRY